MSRLCRLGFAALWIVAVAPPVRAGLTVGSITRIASTSTPIPDGTGDFTSLDPLNFAGAAGGAAFVASGPSGQRGLYTNIGGSLRAVANLNTRVPGTDRTFGGFGLPSVSGDAIAFRGQDPLEGQGLYVADSDGTITTIVAPNQALPGGVAFDNATWLSYDNGDLLFTARAGTALFRASGGVITAIAGADTPIPGGSGAFTTILFPTLAQGRFAFTGRGTADFGIYADLGSGLVSLADTATARPGYGSFFNFGPPSIAGETVVFDATYETGAGVLVSSAGRLRTLVDRNTPIPGGSETFAGFANALLGGDQVLFQGYSTGGELGLYLGSLSVDGFAKVVAPGDQLDGRTVQTVFTPNGFQDGLAIFLVNFTDGSQGLYSAAIVPSPSAGVLTLIGLGALGLRARFRRGDAR